MSLYASQKANDYGEFIVSKLTESVNQLPSGSYEQYQYRNALIETKSRYPYRNIGEGNVVKDNATMSADLIDQFYPDVLGISPNQFKRLSSFEKVDLLQQFSEALGIEQEFAQYVQQSVKKPMKSIQETPYSPTEYSPVYEFSDEEVDSLADGIGYGDTYETNSQTIGHLSAFDPDWRKAVKQDPDLGYLFGRSSWPKFSWNKKKQQRPKSFDSVSIGSDDDYQEYLRASSMGHDDYQKEKRKSMDQIMGNSWAGKPCTSSDYYDPNFDSDYQKVREGNCYRKVGKTTRNQLYDAYLKQAEKSLSFQGYNPNIPRHKSKLDKIFLEYDESVGYPEKFDKKHATEWFKNKFKGLYFRYGSRAKRAKRRSKR